LRILGLLFRQPGLPVSVVAEQLRLPRPVASLYLRALNSRGLLQAERTGSWVRYRPGPEDGAPHAQLLCAALRHAFRNEPDPVEHIYRLATAFTNARRMELYRLLNHGPHPYAQLHASARMSRYALNRHLTKLQSRGFVQQHNNLWRAQPGAGNLARTLAELTR
jgi:DNA-binding IclR family transcriptional regulator